MSHDPAEHIDLATEWTPGFEYQVFLRRDLRTGKPLEAVAWIVWLGGFKELGTWPWDATGLAAAGRWAVQHRAVRETGHPYRHRDDLMVHVDAT